MLKKFISIFLIFSYVTSLQANEINIKVNGLVCELCAITIEKNFKKLSNVEKITIDLDTKNVLLILSKNTDLTNDEITEIIINNGYSVAEINRVNNETK